MARYDYKCESCGTVDERQHGMAESPQELCTVCGGEMRKHFSADSVRTIARCGHNGELSHWEDIKMR